MRFEDGNKTGTYTLIAGAHRLEAFKLLGKTSIDAKIIMKGELEAELIEIDENLIRNEMGYLLRSDTLARKKEIYERLYPETKVGAMNKSNNYGQDLENAEISLSKKPSFVEDTAAKTGLSKRTIETEIQISKNVIPEAKPILQEQNIPKTEAIKLAREEPETQKKIIPIFESGQTKKVEEAKKMIDPIDEAYDKRDAEIEARHNRIKRVLKLIDYTQFTGITEQHIQEYMEDFTGHHSDFVNRCEKAIEIYQQAIKDYNNLKQIRRVK